MFFKWFGGFFQDGSGSASSKRAGLYIALGYLGYLVKSSVAGKTINDTILLYVFLVVLVGFGVVTTENISNFISKKNTGDQTNDHR